MKSRESSRPASSRPSLQTLERALSVLRLFSPAEPQWTLTEISRASGLALATTHRIVGVLGEYGYLERDPESKAFRLGASAVDLAVGARSAVSLSSLARPPLEELARATGETALLTVPDDLNSLCVDRVVSPLPLRLILEPGRRSPLYAGSLQKALLAFLPDAVLTRIIDLGLTRLSRNTITDPVQLREEMRRIRERGYATSFEEVTLGSWGVAVPILNATGSPMAAVGSAGPLARYSDPVLAKHLEACITCRNAIARALDARGWDAATRALTLDLGVAAFE